MSEEIRCPTCLSLLCKRVDGLIEIKKKGLLVYCHGPIVVFCYRCGEKVLVNNESVSVTHA